MFLMSDKITRSSVRNSSGTSEGCLKPLSHRSCGQNSTFSHFCKNLKNKLEILFKKFNSGKTGEAFRDIGILVQKNNTNCELITSYAIMANKLNYISKAIESFTYVLKLVMK